MLSHFHYLYTHQISETTEQHSTQQQTNKPRSKTQEKRSKMVRTSVKCRAERTHNCIVDGCNQDLKEAHSYYKRHRLCVFHAMSDLIYVDNVKSRFCQQCSKLHDPLLFDDKKKSCRASLACHNARRRKIAVKGTDIVQPAPTTVPVAASYNTVQKTKFSMLGQFFELNHMNANVHRNYPNQHPNISKANPILTPPPPPPIQQTSTTLEMFPGIAIPFRLL